MVEPLAFRRSFIVFFHYVTLNIEAHSKTDLKGYLVWIPKYRNKVLIGDLTRKAREHLRQIATENDIEIISDKIAADHVHMFISYRPNQSISKIVTQLKGVSSHILLQEFPVQRKKFLGRDFCALGYLAVISGIITDENNPGVYCSARGGPFG